MTSNKNINIDYRRPFPVGYVLIALSLLGFACLSVNVKANQANTSGPSKAESVEKKQALEELRGQIDKLNRAFIKSEESRNEISDQLKVSEKAISEANRNLLTMATEQREIGRDLADIERRVVTARADIVREENLRDKLIRHQYMYGNTDAMRLMLSGEDVSAVERRLVYLGYVTRSRIAAIGRLKKSVAILAALEVEAHEKQTELAANANEQKKARAMLVAERASRQKILGQVRSDISKNRREVGRLKRDENRLTKLVEQIAIALARKPKADPRSDAKPSGDKTDAGRIRKPGAVVTDEADSGFVGHAFASLRGKLKLPVRGELAGRFGAQREEGGVTWKGLFIRSADGLPVRAVADGRVVFADWLRGYGNLVIVDHGAGFLSLYGHNESLIKQVGDTTSAGESIASVGSTGGALESGVYFELRLDGKPFDPMRWVGK